MTDYFVLTQLILDDLYFPGGGKKLHQLGGGTYTVAGMRVWSKSVGFCCGLGPDYTGNYDHWFQKNGIEMSGAPRTQKCVRSSVTYFENGERDERVVPGYGTFTEMMPQVSEIPASYRNAKGMYVYKDCDPVYWEALKKYIASSSSVVCWEIDSFYATREHRQNIADSLGSIDLFSLNLTEGRRITNETDPKAVVRQLHDLGAKKLILRMGANGALVSEGAGIWHIPAIETKVVDVTGGGNSSTGGFLVGYCETGDLVQAGIMASVAASFILQQYGVPEDMDALMPRAREIAASTQAVLL
ncbi:MAG: PfkB family carbohydrate kinase [Eubacteriales bacterium]|nr:PfkB family carbohydrate kinase [Eubacteriales bacterium]